MTTINYKYQLNNCMRGLTVLIFLLLGIKAKSQHSFDGDIKNNSLAISPNENIAVASYSDSVTVKVYNIKSGKLIKNIAGFINPRNIIFSPDGSTIYITDSGLGLLLAIDAKSFKIIKTYPIGYGAFGSTITKNGDLIFINNEASSTVTVIDATTQSAKKIITGFAQPRQGIKLNPANTKLYVTNFANDVITVVDVATLQIENTINGFSKIRAISITKDGSTLFAANSGTNSIAVVDLATANIIKTIPVGRDPYGASLSLDEKLLLSGNKMDNTLSIIDVATLTNTGSISGFKEPRQAIVFSKNGNEAYVLNNDLSVSIVSLTANKIIRTIRKR